MNGFGDKTADKIEHIELVLEDMGRMNVVAAFKNLRSLTLINVGLTGIEVPFHFDSRVLKTCRNWKRCVSTRMLSPN
jgi:hypothetical protein